MDAYCIHVEKYDRNWHIWTKICDILVIQFQAKVFDSHCSVGLLHARYLFGRHLACTLDPRDAMSDQEGMCGSKMWQDQQEVFLASIIAYLRSAW
jgi:hypothetical protein